MIHAHNNSDEKLDNPSKKKPCIRMLIPLWGEEYFERWFELCAASLFLPGNIPYLVSHSDFGIIFLTKRKDASWLMEHRLIKDFATRATVKAVTIDEFFPSTGTVSYGVPLSLAYAKGINEVGKEEPGAFVVLMNADFLLSDGSLRSLFHKIEEGNHIITAPSIRVVEHHARPLLVDRLSSSRDGSGYSSRELMAVVNEYLHQTVLARTINDPQLVEASYYHLIYWRIDETCIAARYFLLMPLCFQVRRQMEAVTCPVDYGFIEQFCPGGRYTVLADSDEFLMVELQARDSEASLLMPARRFSAAAENLQQKISRIVENASEWTTFEHRRAATHTLLFHSRDLPMGAEEKLAEFDSHMSQMLAALPPPAAIERHPQWLGALRAYRAAMSPHGLASYPRSLLDERNKIVIGLQELSPAPVSAAQPQWPRPAGVTGDGRLVNYLRPCAAVVTLEGLVGELGDLSKSSRIFSTRTHDAHSPDMEICFALPDRFSLKSGETLGLYILVDSVPHLPKFLDLFDDVVAEGGHVTVLCRDREWHDIDFDGRPWILSLLQYFFRSNRYTAEMELIGAGFVVRIGRPAAPKEGEREFGATSADG